MRTAKSSSGVAPRQVGPALPVRMVAAGGGRVDRDDVRERRREAGSSSSAAHEVSAKPPTRARERVRAVRRVGGHGEHRLAASRRGRRAGRRCRCRGGRARCAPPRSRVPRVSRRRRSRLAGRGPARAHRPSANVGLAEHVDRARRARVGLAQHELRRDGAVPAVDLQPHGGVGGLAGVDRQRAAGAEAHAARAGAAGAERERDVAALADRAAGRDIARPGRAARRAGCPSRTGASCWSSSARSSDSASPWATASIRTSGSRSSAVSTGPACSRNASRNASTSSRRDRQARGRVVAAVAQQVAGARVQAAEQVERRDRAARAASPPRRRARSGSPAGGGARRSARRRSRSRPGASPRRPARGRGPRDARPPAPRPRSGSASRRRGARR